MGEQHLPRDFSLVFLHDHRLLLLLLLVLLRFKLQGLVQPRLFIFLNKIIHLPNLVLGELALYYAHVIL